MTLPEQIMTLLKPNYLDSKIYDLEISYVPTIKFQSTESGERLPEFYRHYTINVTLKGDCRLLDVLKVTLKE